MVDGGLELLGTTKDLYAANFNLRIASRILVRVAKFKAANFNQLSNNCMQMPWIDYLLPGAKFAVRVTCKESTLYHRGAVEERIVSCIKASVPGCIAIGIDPTEDSVPDETQLFVVRIYKDMCQISVDSTGTHLHKRGYRQASTIAPLRENLGAAMVVHSGWDRQAPLLDPFCGSGTIPIEAASLANDVPSGRLRSYSFMKWPSYDQKLWKSVTNPRLAIQCATPPLIIGSDILKEAILISEKNSEKAGVRNQIQFQHSAFQDLFPRIKSFLPIENGTQKKGFIISNLPFGKRTDEKDIRGLYQAMGKSLRSFPGWTVLFMVSTYNENLLSHMGVAFDENETRTIDNGGLTVKLKKGIIS